MKLIKFTASWCGPCQAMKRAKTVERLAEKYALDLEVYDTDDKLGRALSDERDVDTIPTVLLVDGRGRELARSEAASLTMLEKTFAKYF
jgi:thiol-disulfide isomerase/thioredoxin